MKTGADIPARDSNNVTDLARLGGHFFQLAKSIIIEVMELISETNIEIAKANPSSIGELLFVGTGGNVK